MDLVTLHPIGPDNAIAIRAGDSGFDSCASQIEHCHQRLATSSMFLRSCVAHCPGDKPWRWARRYH